MGSNLVSSDFLCSQGLPLCREKQQSKMQGKGGAGNGCVLGQGCDR